MSNSYTLGFLLVLIAAIISLIAQSKVQGAYSKYSKIDAYIGKTGAMIAREMLQSQGLYDVTIREVSGKLSDHYNPSNKTVNLSSDIYHGTSIASIAIACHECGHAIQHAQGYKSLVIRNSLIPTFNIMNTIGYGAIMIGYATSMLNIALVGVILISGMLCYQLLTLPIEFDASKRALAYIDEYSMLQGSTYKGAKSMLSAAAFTYVAAMLASLASILRLLLIILGNNRRND